MPRFLGFSLNIRDRKSRAARDWSNAELRRFATELRGDVVNISAWRDEDKQGAHYRDYFTQASSYSITNWRGERGASAEAPGEILLDLEAPLPGELTGRFDVVLSHTTLEHVFKLQQAFDNLCAMSRETVIIVVPFLQELHYTESFLDYWRFSPFALRRLLEERGFTVIYESFSDPQENAGIYIFSLATRRPESFPAGLPRQFLKHPVIGSETIRNDPFTILATRIYRMLRASKFYRRLTKRFIEKVIRKS